MVFYIVAIIVLIITVRMIIEDGDWGISLMGFVVSVVIGFVVVMIFFVAIPQEKDEISQNTYMLRAIDTGSSVNGHSFFLGGGYVNEKRVLNYLYEDSANGKAWTSVAMADADESRIFEDEAKKPNVVITDFVFRNGWVLPFDFNIGTKTYDFHIPEGSVLNNYEITNK